MPTEVRSPINRKSNDVTLSPGARSIRRDSEPDQPKQQLEADARRASKKSAPASARVFGPPRNNHEQMAPSARHSARSADVGERSIRYER